MEGQFRSTSSSRFCATALDEEYISTLEQFFYGFVYLAQYIS